MIQEGKIDVTKIPKDAIFVGQKGKYVSFTLFDNRDGTDEYGNDGVIKLRITKAQREAGEKPPILGNWKYVGQKPSKGAPPVKRQAATTQPDDDSDSVPF